MSKRDYYDVLGVEKNADDKAIKAAFRKLAMANHPDRNQGDDAAENRFREANEAYDILKDPQKRVFADPLKCHRLHWLHETGFQPHRRPDYDQDDWPSQACEMPP